MEHADNTCVYPPSTGKAAHGDLLLRRGDVLDEGTVGLDLPNLDAAKEEPFRAARELLAERIALRMPVEGQIFEVCDADGSMIFSVKFRDVLHS